MSSVKASLAVTSSPEDSSGQVLRPDVLNTSSADGAPVMGAAVQASSLRAPSVLAASSSEAPRAPQHSVGASANEGSAVRPRLPSQHTAGRDDSSARQAAAAPRGTPTDSPPQQKEEHSADNGSRARELQSSSPEPPPHVVGPDAKVDEPWPKLKRITDRSLRASERLSPSTSPHKSALAHASPHASRAELATPANTKVNAKEDGDAAQTHLRILKPAESVLESPSIMQPPLPQPPVLTQTEATAASAAKIPVSSVEVRQRREAKVQRKAAKAAKRAAKEEKQRRRQQHKGLRPSPVSNQGSTGPSDSFGDHPAAGNSQNSRKGEQSAELVAARSSTPTVAPLMEDHDGHPRAAQPPSLLASSLVPQSPAEVDVLRPAGAPSPALLATPVNSVTQPPQAETPQQQTRSRASVAKASTTTRSKFPTVQGADAVFPRAAQRKLKRDGKGKKHRARTTKEKVEQMQRREERRARRHAKRQARRAAITSVDKLVHPPNKSSPSFSRKSPSADVGDAPTEGDQLLNASKVFGATQAPAAAADRGAPPAGGGEEQWRSPPRCYTAASVKCTPAPPSSGLHDHSFRRRQIPGFPSAPTTNLQPRKPPTHEQFRQLRLDLRPASPPADPPKAASPESPKVDGASGPQTLALSPSSDLSCPSRHSSMLKAASVSVSPMREHLCEVDVSASSSLNSPPRRKYSHRPGAAGSAAVAVHELKQQREHPERLLESRHGHAMEERSELAARRTPDDSSVMSDHEKVQSASSSDHEDRRASVKHREGHVRTPSNVSDSSRGRSSSVSSFTSYSGGYSSDSYQGSSYSTYTTSYSDESEDASGAPHAISLKEGCTAPPPAKAFTDLSVRASSLAQLQTYAETAVICEWNVKEGWWGCVETQVVVSPEPFAKGSMRASYHMIDLKRLGCKLIAKRYLKRHVVDDQYFDDVSMHSMAGHWARLYNACSPPKKVQFVPAAVMTLSNRTPPLTLAMEPQLEGSFMKYNNNCGYVPKQTRWTPQAFSHFTFHASTGKVLIVDIQGVGDLYTDPQILSPDGKGYGRGNLGMKGIRRFIRSHRCNAVCKALELPELHSGKTPSPNVVSPFVRRHMELPAALEIRQERLPPKLYKTDRSGPPNSHLNSSRRSVLPSIAQPDTTPPPAAITFPLPEGPVTGVPPVYSGYRSPAAPAPFNPPPFAHLPAPHDLSGAPSTPKATGYTAHNAKFMERIRGTASRQQTNYFTTNTSDFPLFPILPPQGKTPNSPALQSVSVNGSAVPSLTKPLGMQRQPAGGVVDTPSDASVSGHASKSKHHVSSSSGPGNVVFFASPPQLAMNSLPGSQLKSGRGSVSEAAHSSAIRRESGNSSIRLASHSRRCSSGGSQVTYYPDSQHSSGNAPIISAVEEHLPVYHSRRFRR